MHRKFLIIIIFMSFFDCFASVDNTIDEDAKQDQALSKEASLLPLNQQLYQELLGLGSIDDARITGHRRFREQTNLNEDEQIERLHQSRRRHGINIDPNLDPNLDPNRRVISRVGSYDQFQASLASQTIIQENN